MTAQEKMHVCDLIKGIRLISYKEYKDYIPEIERANLDNVNIEPLKELNNSMFTAVKIFNQAMYYIYDFQLDLSELEQNPDYTAIAVEYANKAVAKRNELEQQAKDIVTPFLNFETDKENKYGLNKESSEIVINSLNKPKGYAIIAAKMLFMFSKPNNPVVMRAHYKLQHLKEELLSIKKTILLEYLESFGFEEAYNFICERIIANGKTEKNYQ